MRPERPAADWREAADYAVLLRADRSAFAWEWLRRNTGYRRAAQQSVDRGSARPKPEAHRAAEHWGLHAFEPADLPAPLARPLWTKKFAPSVLSVAAIAASAAGDIFELERFGCLATLRRTCGHGEHLLLSDGFRSIRLDVATGTLVDGPVQLRYLLSGFESAHRPLLTLRRFIALVRAGGFARSLHPPEPRARRWVMMLRAYDALANGADQRSIAEVLLRASAAVPRWRSKAPSLRSQVQRLVRSARQMAEGGYAGLLK
jgi:hypothetical protein